MKTLSILTPCYNEEGGIAECYEAVRRVMERDLPAYAYEHIFIDNASADRTVEILRGIAAADQRVKVIVNSRNFGPDRSPYHAMLQASGDAIVPILADLQTPPQIIPELVTRWEGGAKLVVAVRRNSDQPFASRLARGIFYRLMRSVSRVEQIPNFMGYGLYDRLIVETLRGLNEPDPYFRGLVCEIGFDRAVVLYDQPPRRHGRSSYSLFSLVDFALRALSSHSQAPLRLMTASGVVIALVSFLIGIVYLAVKLLFWDYFSAGIAPILIAVFFFGAVQLLAIGIVGEYIGLLVAYSRRFPLVIEKERINYE